MSSNLRCLAAILAAVVFAGYIAPAEAGAFDPAMGWEPLFDKWVEPEHTKVALTAAQLGPFDGFYELQPGTVVTLRHVGGSELVQIYGMREMQIFPESRTTFYFDRRPAEIRVDLDENGLAKGLIVNDDGWKRYAKKVERDVALHSVYGLWKHRDTARPSAGTYAALQRHLAALVTGQPDYDALTPEFGAHIRAEVAQRQDTFKSWGPLKSAWFRGVSPTGADIYEVDLQHAQLICGIMPLDPDGKIADQSCRYGPRNGELAE